MFFLLRVAFWLTIVLALLPSGSNSTASAPKMGETVSAAGAAISDLRHFCAREPEACEVGSQAAVMIGQRAQAGAKMLYELFSEHAGPSATGSVAVSKSAPAGVASAGNGHGTLRASDQVPAWRGSERR